MNRGTLCSDYISVIAEKTTEVLTGRFLLYVLKNGKPIEYLDIYKANHAVGYNIKFTTHKLVCGRDDRRVYYILSRVRVCIGYSEPIFLY